MATLDEILDAYQKCKRIPSNLRTEKIPAGFELIRKLLSNNSPEALELHYSLLADHSDRDTYLDVRSAFMDRKGGGDFLLDKLTQEQHETVVADIIQILGDQRNPKAYELAMSRLNDPSDRIREVCLFVIGWVGTENDIATLAEHLLAEKTHKLRLAAAGAMRQIALRLPSAKASALSALKRAFYQDASQEGRTWVIIFMASIAGKKLGLREDDEDPYVVVGDYDKAVTRTEKFLESID